jgi:hypothetical protein
MISTNNKWLIHTLLVGLIPILTRLLSWAVTASGAVEPLATSDTVKQHFLSLHRDIRNTLYTCGNRRA